ncbi:hypothetical protein [Sphingobium aquiterrae]|uniref:SMP-30/gluconolactonase/LRE family protein n=1 Tax=Sphingobium aquiterrae TaxID=2038656 RepID=UPI0030184D5A
MLYSILDDPDDQQWPKIRNTRPPMARIGKPEEIAGAAVLPASDEAPFMTGENEEVPIVPESGCRHAFLAPMQRRQAMIRAFLTILLPAVAMPAALAQALAQAPAASVAPPPSKILADVGFAGSECVRYDDRADDYIVSNLNQGGDANDGFLSRVSPDGTVTQLKWIEGGRNGVTLVQPLGLFIKGDLIYVADLRTVHMLDRRSGTPRGSIAVPGAVRLNDLAVADDGTIYVSDSGSDDNAGAIYAIRDGKPSLFARRDDAVERPNGIAVMADGTVVHGGRGVNLVFRDRSGTILRERSLPTGRMDGIIPLPGGTLLVASQDGHNVYRVPADGKAEVVAQDITVPAAIGWDSRRNRLLVPQIRAASLGFYELAR